MIFISRVALAFNHLFVSVIKQINHWIDLHQINQSVQKLAVECFDLNSKKWESSIWDHTSYYRVNQDENHNFGEIKVFSERKKNGYKKQIKWIFL